nr:hypothetical protein [Tanacetum cinerariifolium]
MEQKPNPSGSGTQEQLDEFDAWMDDFSTDDEVSTEEVSQKLLAEISREVDEAQLKEDSSVQLPKKPAPVYHSCQRNPKASPTTLLNQDLFYLKHVLNMEESMGKATSHQKAEREIDKPEEVYSESKIIEVIKTLYELGHEHKFKRDCGMESYQQKVNLTAPTIIFPGIERKKLLTITSKLVVGLIYENSKKEKRVAILKEIPKFCDATLKRVLEMVKQYNKDVKYGYADPSPTDADQSTWSFMKNTLKTG